MFLDGTERSGCGDCGGRGRRGGVRGWGHGCGCGRGSPSPSPGEKRGQEITFVFDVVLYCVSALISYLIS